MAAGLSIESANVDLLRQRLNDMARSGLSPDQLRPRLKLDADVMPHDLTMAQVEELAWLDPVGQANPPVRLAVRGLNHARSPHRVGKENQHAKFRVGIGRHIVEAVWWNCREAALPTEPFDLAFTPTVVEYQGRRSVQLKVLDWQPSAPVIHAPPPQ
jgi:single-stranded-DNA-specific exonuclease